MALLLILLTARTFFLLEHKNIGFNYDLAICCRIQFFIIIFLFFFFAISAMDIITFSIFQNYDNYIPGWYKRNRHFKLFIEAKVLLI
jgi:hypothetical protein